MTATDLLQNPYLLNVLRPEFRYAQFPNVVEIAEKIKEIIREKTTAVDSLNYKAQLGTVFDKYGDLDDNLLIIWSYAQHEYLLRKPARIISLALSQCAECALAVKDLAYLTPKDQEELAAGFAKIIDAVGSLNDDDDK